MDIDTRQEEENKHNLELLNECNKWLDGEGVPRDNGGAVYSILGRLVAFGIMKNRQLADLRATIEEASNKPFDHKQRHVELHRSLDELIADFVTHTDKMPSQTSLRELMEWAYQQTIEPTEKE